MKKRDLVYWMIGAFILIAGCMQSCVSVEKQIRKAKNVAYQYPNEFADFCGTVFPVKTVYKEGKPVVTKDTVYQKGPTIPCPESKNGEQVNVKCPDSKVIYKTVYRTDTVEKENTAKLEAEKQKNYKIEAKQRETEDKLSEALESRNKYRLYFFSLAGVILLVSGIIVYFKFFKRI